MKKIIITLMITIMVLIGCSNSNKETIGVSSDTQAIGNMFPALEGVLETKWEQEKLGSGDDRVPGPTDYTYRGYVTLDEEAAANYAASYEWTDAEPDVVFMEIEAVEGNWKYSSDFADDIIPGYYFGSVWLDGNTLLFCISTM